MKRFAVGVAMALGLGVTAPAAAQTLPLPPLPPLPPETSLVLEYVAPIASPVCGNAGFAVLIVQGTASSLPVVLDLPTVFGPAFVVCGAVPTPSAPLTCAPDLQAQGVLDDVFGAALGSTSLVSGRLVGPLVEQVIVVQDALPPPLSTAGLGSLAVGALECRAPVTPPQPAAPDLPASEVALSPPFEATDLPLLTSVGDFGAVDVSASGPESLGAASPPRQLGRAAPVAAVIGGRDIAVLVYLLPLLIAALCVVVARGLLVDLG